MITFRIPEQYALNVDLMDIIKRNVPNTPITIAGRFVTIDGTVTLAQKNAIKAELTAALSAVPEFTTI